MPKEVYTITQDEEEEEEYEEIEEPKKRISTPYIIIIVLIVLIIILIAIIVIMILIKRKAGKSRDLPDNQIANGVGNNSNEMLINPTGESLDSPVNPIATPIGNPIVNNSSESFTPTKVFNDHVENIANAINETNNSNELPISNGNPIANPIGNNSNESIVNPTANTITNSIGDNSTGTSSELPGGLPAIEDMLNEVKKGRDELVKSQSAITPEIDNNFTQSIGSIDESEKAKFNFEAMNNIIV